MVLGDDVLLVEVQGQVKGLDTDFLHLLTSHLGKRHNPLHVLFQLRQGAEGAGYDLVIWQPLVLLKYLQVIQLKLKTIVGSVLVQTRVF
jgi:hypothetical protein